LELDQIADVRFCGSHVLKLISSEIIFEVFKPMLSQYLNVTEAVRRTDRQTDNIPCHNRALRSIARNKQTKFSKRFLFLVTRWQEWYRFNFLV